jgi:phthiocerol/phenolphthiocerol synthesis type-I polyketide synthase C
MRHQTGSEPTTLVDLLKARADCYRDMIAFDYTPDGDSHLQLTYHELDLKARAIASSLQQQGATGERVLVLCPSGLEFIAGLFGCFYAGAVAVPVHPPVGKKLMARVASIVVDAQARYALTTTDIQPTTTAVVGGLPDGASLRWSATDAIDPAAARQWEEPDVDSDATAFLQYTSGSTSTPKGVVLSHGNLLSNLKAIQRLWAADDRTTGVSWLPLHHDMGLIAGILETIYSGGLLYLMPPSAFIERPMRWLEMISRTGARISGAPNFAYELCVERSSAQERASLDLSHWTYCFCGAEPVRESTIQRFADAFAPAGFEMEAFHPVYGLAEATLLVSGRSDWALPVVRHLDRAALSENRAVDVAPDGTAATIVGCGQPQHTIEVVIADPATRQSCADDEVGEIWVGGPSIPRSYWGRPAESADTFSASLSDSGRGPFLRTGDLGFVRDGELFITGRLKDLIIIRGRNHFPEDIESTVQSSHPALLPGRGAAFSVAPHNGAAEHLVVVQEVIRDRLGDIDVSAVVESIRAGVSTEHDIQAHAVVLVQPFRIPTTSSGKIQRGTCRQRFLDSELEVVAEWHAPVRPTGPPTAAPAEQSAAHTAKEIAAWVVSHLSEDIGLPRTEIDTSRQFAHYGMDSVHAIRLTAALGAWLGREVPPTLPYDYPTIDLLTQYLTDDVQIAAPAAAEASDTADARIRREDEPIAIIGIGCRFPGAAGPAAFWQLLSEGIDAISEVPPDRWDADEFYDPTGKTPGTATTRWGGFVDHVDQFDAEFFGISPRESARMDPQQRLLLEVSAEALDDACQVPERLAGTSTGVFIGISTYDYGQFQLGELDLADVYTGTGSALSIAANRLSYIYDLRGPSMAIDTACSSSLVAIHTACRSLRDGECTLAIAGGANVMLSPAVSINFSLAGVMAPDGRCKTFDAGADGYVRGEGAGIVVLKPLSTALTDGDPVYAVIRGSAINQDGRTNGLMAPNRLSQEAVLAEAYRCADLSPEAVQYVEAHGTGTSLGDTIEANALATVLGPGRAPDNRCLIGSVKTNIGHLEAAAGVAGLIKVALSLAHRMIPPSLHFVKPNPNIDFDGMRMRVPTTLTPWPDDGRRAVAGVSSFGFGGANAHVVLTEAPHVRAPLADDDTATPRMQLLPLSARSPEALTALAGRYEQALDTRVRLGDLCYTAGARRGHHPYRLAVLGDSPTAIREALAAYRKGEPYAGMSNGRCVPGHEPGVVFVFSGQGSQWCGMAQRLTAEEPAFRDALAACDRAMGPYLGGSVLSELLADPAHSRLDDVCVIQPAIFAVQVALVALWRSWGVEPAAVVGHSLGEVAAAHIAGALTLENAAQIICGRARLLKRLSGRGAMMAAELSLLEAQDLVGCLPNRVSIGANNSHRSTVLSGDSAALSDLAAVLEQRGRFCRLIKVDVASHSPQMDELRDDLHEVLAGIRPTAPKTPMYSTLTGDLLADVALDEAYWVDNLCSPACFSTAMRRLLENGYDTVVEISPHPILLSAIREDADDLGRACTLLPSTRRGDDGLETLLGSLGNLYTRGQPILWEQLHPWGSRCVPTPAYPWQRHRCWLDTPPGSTGWSRRAAIHQLPSRRMLQPAGQPETVIFETELSTEAEPILADHRVDGAVVLSAASLIDLVLTTASEAFGAGKRVLRDVVLHRSLVLEDAVRITAQLVFNGNPTGGALFECYSAEPQTPDSSPWRLLASGTIHLADECGRDAAPHAVEAVRTRCPEQISRTSFYRLLEERGLQYGPAFQAVHQVWRRDGEAIARLSTTTPQRKSAKAAHQAPTGAGAPLLDACFQVLAATLPAHNGDGHDTYLPVGVSEVAGDQTGIDGVWCHALLRAGSDPEPNTVEGDIFLLNENGQVVVAAHGLRLQRLSGGARAVDPLDSCYELRWRTSPLEQPDQDAPSGPVEAGSWLIFRESSAVSEGLRKGLEQHSQTCVLVEPGDDFVRLGPHRYQLNPSEPQQFRQLLDDAFGPQGPPCRGVVHLWSLLCGPLDEPSAAALDTAVTMGPSTVLHLVQALAELPQAPRLWLVTQGAQAVGTTVDPVAVAAAPLWGMGRSIDREYPELRCTRVDLPAGESGDATTVLFDELWADGLETDIAFRSGTRYVARLTRYDETCERRHIANPSPTPEGGTYRIECRRAGTFDDLRARAVSRIPPNRDEIEIRVHACGLNFIDVMRTLGVYPGQQDEPVRVGIECAGTVTAVGENVEDLHVGDAVIALAMDGLGSFVTTPADLVAVKPAQLTFEEAAAIPIAFLTAYYSLHEQARLRRGERVLIHSAAGGVGLAALEVARWSGAEVYATAGTPEKRDLLRALGVKHVSDSRSLDFANEVLAASGGQGVDVVLNSLAGDAVAKSLAALGPYGRFVEIGKRDIYQHGRLRLWQLRRNATYTVVDLAQLAMDRPAYVGGLLREIVAHFEQGAFLPLPVRTFPVAETAAAVRCLAQGRQIGKIVVAVDRQTVPYIEPAEPHVEFTSEATYLITGGLGGLGRTVANWMVEQGARHLVLMGRGSPSNAAQRIITDLRSRGCEVVVARGDVTRADQTAAVLDSVRTSMPPLRGIVHAAGVLDDGILARLDQRRLRDVLSPKMDGAWHLHKLTMDDPLDFFVLFSSAAAILGAPGQAHYAAGNAFLDALAWHRRVQGLPALSINWGPWADVGLATAAEQVRHLTQHGVEAIPVADGLRMLSLVLRLPLPSVAVLQLDWTRWRNGLPADTGAPMYSELVSGSTTESAAGQPGIPHEAREALRRAGPQERQRLLERYLRDRACDKLGLAPERLDLDRPLDQLGVDSLIATELRTQIERELGILVPVVELLNGPTVTGLAERLRERVGNEDSLLADPPPMVDTSVTQPGGASSRWIGLLTTVPDATDDAVDELLRTVLAARRGESHA